MVLQYVKRVWFRLHSTVTGAIVRLPCIQTRTECRSLDVRLALSTSRSDARNWCTTSDLAHSRLRHDGAARKLRMPRHGVKRLMRQVEELLTL